MKNQLTLLIGIVLLVILLSYMFFFQVPYDRVAVLTTFEGAASPERDSETGQVLRDPDTGTLVEPGSVKEEPGIYFKAPWPIQKVYTYPRKLQVLDVQPEQVMTADDYAVIVRTYLTWQIVDPYAFFREVETIENAQRRLIPMMRDVQAVITDYRFDELVNPNANNVKLEQIEEDALERLQQRLATAGYGIEARHVGIRRIVLPETTTEQVFERMRATRERLAERARTEGEAQAATIRSQAESARQRILAFAERRASAIRDEGRSEAAQYYTAFQDDEEFAIFLRQIEALRNITAHNTTFVLDAESLSILRWFQEEPGMAEGPTPVADEAEESVEQAAEHLAPLEPGADAAPLRPGGDGE